jgi:hypothetical protein
MLAVLTPGQIQPPHRGDLFFPAPAPVFMLLDGEDFIL